MIVSPSPPHGSAESRRRPGYLTPLGSPFHSARRHTKPWAFLLLLGLFDCPGCPLGPADKADEPVPTVPPEVASIEIVPSRVYVQTTGAKFLLRARLRESDGKIISEDWGLESELEWKWQPASIGTQDLIEPVKSGHSAYLETPAVSASTVLTMVVTIGVVSDEAKILLVPDDPQTGDRIVYTPRNIDPPDPPAVALVDGFSPVDGQSAECVVDSRDKPIALVGVGPLEANLVGDCTTPVVRGAVAFFSPGKQMAYSSVPWNPANSDVVNFRMTVTSDDVYHQDLESLGTPLDLEAKVWVPFDADPGITIAGLTQAEVVERLVDDEIAEANWVYGGSLLGITLSRDTPIEHKDLPSLVIESGSWDCKEVPERLDNGLDSGVPPEAFSANTLNVFYILKLQKLVNGEPRHAGKKGLACLPDPDAANYATRRDLGGIVLIDWGIRDQSTLAHELGHMLALNEPPLPYSGHTRLIHGLERMNNLMWTKDPYPREHLSVGQVFRMNVDARSWVNQAQLRATGVPFMTWKCQCDPDLNTPRDPSQTTCANKWCPKLWIDIKEPFGETQTQPGTYTCPSCPTGGSGSP